MVALAYLLPPVSGFLAFIKGRSERMRLHGLQSLLLGAAWPASLYVCSWIAPLATQLAFVAFASLWVALIVGAAMGKDPILPGLGPLLRQASREGPNEGLAREGLAERRD